MRDPNEIVRDQQQDAHIAKLEEAVRKLASLLESLCTHKLYEVEAEFPGLAQVEIWFKRANEAQRIAAEFKQTGDQ